MRQLQEQAVPGRYGAPGWLRDHGLEVADRAEENNSTKQADSLALVVHILVATRDESLLVTVEGIKHATRRLTAIEPHGSSTSGR